MRDQQPASILVFDSGIGGISVARSIQKLLPGLQIHYACDNKHLPYGKQQESFLLERIPQIIEFALEKTEADLLVIACNTASTLVLPTLRARFSCPVVGVVPAIKPASLHSQFIALLATSATLQRDYTHELIRDFANGSSILPIDASQLVLLAEEKLASTVDEHKTEQLVCSIQTALSALSTAIESQPIDTAVLGCTHFPLLREELKQAFPMISNWLDSGDAIARRVDSLLSDAGFDTEALKQHKQTQTTGFANKTCFISSATKEYCTGQLHPLRFDKKLVFSGD